MTRRSLTVKQHQDLYGGYHIVARPTFLNEEEPTFCGIPADQDWSDTLEGSRTVLAKAVFLIDTGQYCEGCRREFRRRYPLVSDSAVLKNGQFSKVYPPIE